MPIGDFPREVRELIDSNTMQREMEAAAASVVGYRALATRVAAVAAVVPARPTTLWRLRRDGAKEQFTAAQEMHTGSAFSLPIGHPLELKAGVRSHFLHNAWAAAFEGAQALNALAGAALVGGCLRGNTWVRKGLEQPSSFLPVDDIRGFGPPFPSPTAVGSGRYKLVGVLPETSASSATPDGIPGVLCFDSAIAAADGKLSVPVTGFGSSLILRANEAPSIGTLGPADGLTLRLLRRAVSLLRLLKVAPVMNAYNCYLDPVSFRQFAADPEARALFPEKEGPAAPWTYHGIEIESLCLRFILTEGEHRQAHPLHGRTTVRRVIVGGAGALIETPVTPSSVGAPVTSWVDGFRVLTALCDAPDPPAWADGFRVVRALCDAPDPSHIIHWWEWSGGFAPLLETAPGSSAPADPEMTAYHPQSVRSLPADVPMFRRAVLIEHT